LRSSEGKLTHLGISAKPLDAGLRQRASPVAAPSRGVPGGAGALAAPGERPAEVRFKHKRVSLDSTVIDRCATLFD